MIKKCGIFSNFFSIFVIVFTHMVLIDVKASNNLDVSALLDGDYENKIISIKIDEHLYFFCEKYNHLFDVNKWEENESVWLDYSSSVRDYATNMRRHSDLPLQKGLIDATQTFDSALGYFAHKKHIKGDLWIAYVSNIPYEELNKKRKSMRRIPSENIQMSVSLAIINPTIYSPVGILRNPLYDFEPTPSLSGVLHGLCAFVMQSIYPDLKIMLTKPSTGMREIFNKILSKYPSYLYHDHDYRLPSHLQFFTPWNKIKPTSQTLKEREEYIKKQELNMWAREQNGQLKVVYDGQEILNTENEPDGAYDFLRQMQLTPYYGVSTIILENIMLKSFAPEIQIFNFS